MTEHLRLAISDEACTLLRQHTKGRDVTMGDIVSQLVIDKLSPHATIVTPERVYAMLETLHDLLVALAHRLEHLDAPTSAVPTPPPAPSTVPQPTPPPAARSSLSRLFFRED